MALAEMRDRRLFNELLFAAYEGMSRGPPAHPRRRGVRHACIKRALYPGARDLVQRCRDEGHDVVLVSGALDFLMKRLADHLGATGVIANRLEIKDGFATGKLLRPVVAGPEKARLVREHARDARPRPRRLLRLLGQLLRRPDALGRRPPRRGEPRPASSRLARERRTQLAHHPPRRLDDARAPSPATDAMSHPLVVTLDSRSAPRTLFSRRPPRRGRPARRARACIYPKPPLEPLKDVDAAIRYAINHPLRLASRSTRSSARG